MPRKPDDWLVTGSEMKIDRADARILLGVLAVSLIILWTAAVLGLSVYVFRHIGGL